MTGAATSPDIKRKWYRLAVRHLRMARRLLGSGFADGAFFHAYHGYECALNAVIAASGYAVPPAGATTYTLPSGKKSRAYPSPKGRITETSVHKARVAFFDEVADRGKPYFTTHARLSSFLSIPARNSALYYDSNLDLLPQQRYGHRTVLGLLRVVEQFAGEVWQDIR
jgi:hypothetical protein